MKDIEEIRVRRKSYVLVKEEEMVRERKEVRAN